MQLQRIFLDYPLDLYAERIGPDISVSCTGGCAPHIGGTAIAVPYHSDDRLHASVSSLSIPGHQDAVLAAQIAKRLCIQCRTVVSVQCGIHYDRLQPKQLDELLAAIHEMVDELEGQL